VKTKGLTTRLVPRVYGDDSLVAVVKPAGVDTGGARDGSAPGLVEWLQESIPGAGRLHVSNRLSRYESGLLLLAKSRSDADHIRRDLERGRVELEYHALVRGRMPRKTVVLGEPANLGRTAQKVNRPKLRGSPTERATLRPIEPTTVTLLEQLDDQAWVRIQTRVENTHALRAQLRGSKMRLLGDRLHDLSKRPASPRETCLHLTRMVYPRQGRKDPLVIKAPLDTLMPPAGRETAPQRELHAALVRRLPCLAEPDLDCYRLLSGGVEDLPGLAAERYGSVVVLQLHEPKDDLLIRLKSIAHWYRKALGVEAVYVKPFTKNRPGADEIAVDELHSPEPLVGRAVPPEIIVCERGLRFAIRPYDGFNVGLFLDHRDNRTHLRELSANKTVLNLFAYTCGFSVSAALGGAARTVSIDVSAKHLEWGRRNFRLNGVAVPDAADPLVATSASDAIHEFHRAGAVEYLDRATRRGQRFDIVVVDPPTYAHGKRTKDRFSITRDLPVLLKKVVGLISDGGVLLLSTNHRKMSPSDLRRQVISAAHPRRVEILSTPALPPDFVMDPFHAKSIWVRA